MYSNQEGQDRRSIIGATCLLSSCHFGRERQALVYRDCILRAQFDADDLNNHGEGTEAPASQFRLCVLSHGVLSHGTTPARGVGLKRVDAS